jgi:hypothetical protein
MGIVFSIAVFIYFGFSKSTIFNRPYYLQAFLGLGKYPFGVGLGNFEIISRNIQLESWHLGGFSVVAHDIVFEIVAALGLFSSPFIYWFASTITDPCINS